MYPDFIGTPLPHKGSDDIVQVNNVFFLALISLTLKLLFLFITFFLFIKRKVVNSCLAFIISIADVIILNSRNISFMGSQLIKN